MHTDLHLFFPFSSESLIRFPDFSTVFSSLIISLYKLYSTEKNLKEVPPGTKTLTQVGPGRLAPLAPSPSSQNTPLAHVFVPLVVKLSVSTVSIFFPLY